MKLDSEDEGNVTQMSVTVYQSTRHNIRTTSRLYSSVTASLDLLRLLYFPVFVSLHCETLHFTEYQVISYINWAYLGHYTDYATGSTAEESWFDSWQGRENFFLQGVRTVCGTHPASCLLDTGYFPPGGKAVGARVFSTSIYYTG